jgi:hypothetical protein
MTDRRDPLERTDDKTTEDAGQDLTDPRETAHPPPGMTRRSRTSKRAARLGPRSAPRTRPIPAVLSTDHARPGTRSDAVLASLGAMHGWIAGPPLRRKQCISRTFRVLALPRSAGVSSARLTWGW